MIKIYDGSESDFSTLGLGVLLPTECEINWEAGGMYDLRLVHPIDDDARWTLIDYGRIIKAPGPVREAPIVEAGNEGQTITRQIYKVQTSGPKLRMRAKASLSAKILGSYKSGTEVIRVSVSGDWAKVIIKKGGATGWMWNGNLTFVRTETETINGDKPGGVVEIKQVGEQLFRITEVERDPVNKLVAVSAMHISYDLRANSVKGVYSPEKVAAATVVSEIMARAVAPHVFDVHCFATGNITGEYGGRSIIDCLFNPDDGIAKQLKARVVRDNFDIYILPDAERDMGVEIRYAKNMLAASLKVDAADVVTRIEPAGKDKDGKPLFLTGNGYVDSPRIGDYPAVYARRIEYPVQIGKDNIDNATQARTKLTELANADFENGIDLPSISLDVDFVALGDTAEYAEFAEVHAVHPYDTVAVKAPGIGVSARLRLTKCTWDVLAEKYNATTFGEIKAIQTAVYGYNIAPGAVGGTKIAGNAVDSMHLRELAVRYAHMDYATIEQLTADSITATRALIKQLAAEEITTDELYAALAMIAIAQITTANIENANITWANIQSLVTEMARIANAEIETADISWAHIKDLITGNAIFTEGVGGKLFVSRLAVTEANMVSLTTGELVVKGADGNFYAITIVDGVVTPVKKEITGDNMANSTIPGGKMIENTITARELNATSIFADSATIRDMIADNLSVDKFFARVATINALKVATVGSLLNGSVLELNHLRAIFRTPEFLVEIPGAEEGEEKLRINAEGLFAPSVESPTVAKRHPGGVYRVGINFDYQSLSDAFDDLEGAVLGGDVVLKLGSDNDPGGTLRGVRGGHSVTITSGNLIERYACYTNGATLSADGTYGYKVTATTAGTYRWVAMLIGRVGDLDLRGKSVSFTMDSSTHSGATALSAGLGHANVDYTDIQILGSNENPGTPRTVTVPEDVDEDRLLVLLLYISRETSCDAGAYRIYDRLRVEFGEADKMFSWPTANYRIADLGIVGCDRVNLSRTKLPTGVRIRDSDVALSRSEIFGDVGVLVDMARVLMRDNSGNCAKAVKARCAQVYVTGPAPGGTYEGWQIDTTTAQISGGGSAGNEQTKTLTANATGTYGPSNWWSSDRAIRQGYTPSNGRLRGGMWWDFSTIPSGATVTAMRLTLKRTSGYGKGANVTLKAYGTNSNARSGQPALTKGPYTLGVINQGQTKTFDLPAALVTALANGTVKGIVLYADDTSVLSGKTYSTNYARFDGTDGTAPKLAVTFTT